MLISCTANLTNHKQSKLTINSSTVPPSSWSAINAVELIAKQ